MSLAKKFAGGFALIVFTIVLCFLAGEGLLRATGYFQGIDYRIYYRELVNSDRLPQAIWRKDSAMGVGLQPNSQVLASTSDFSVVYTINSMGWRDHERTYRRGNESMRVLALGDSMTFGEGVKMEERFTSIAESSLPDVEFINMGVPGFGIDQMLMSFVIEGRKFAAEQVFIFLISADIDRYNLYIMDGNQMFGERVSDQALDQGQSTTMSHTAYVRKDRLKSAFKSHAIFSLSYFLSYSSYIYSAFAMRHQFKVDDEKQWGQSLISADGKPEKIAPRRAPEEKGKQRSLILLAKLAELCRENKSKLTIVNIDNNDEMTFLQDLEGTRYINLAADLKHQSLFRPLSFVYDRHYNSQTHQYIGKKLAEIIRQDLDSISTTPKQQLPL